MPVYEYECAKCEHVTESLRAMRDMDAPIVCEKCGSEKTHRVHSVVAAPVAGASSPSGSASPGHTHTGSCCCGRGACGMG